MKRVALVQDTELDNRIMEKLSHFPDIRFDFYPLQSFYPHLVLQSMPDLVIFDISTNSTNWLWRLEQITVIADDWGIRSPCVIVLSSKLSEELERKIRGAKVDFCLPKVYDDPSLDIAFAQVLS